MTTKIDRINVAEPQLFEVWRMAFRYEAYPEKSKERPVVIGAINKETQEVLLLAVKITSHAARSCCAGDVVLEDWQEARLEKIIRCSLLKAHGCSFKDLSQQEKIRTYRMITLASLMQCCHRRDIIETVRDCVHNCLIENHEALVTCFEHLILSFQIIHSMNFFARVFFQFGKTLIPKSRTSIPFD